MNTGEIERLWKLGTRANELVLEGKRDAEPLIQALQKFVYGSDLSYDVWQEVYDKLGLSAEYANLAALQDTTPASNLWIIPVVKGATCNKVVAALRKLGVKVDLYTEDLDSNVTENDRDPNRSGSYTIGFGKNVEADEGNKNLSANQLKAQNHKGITLLERLLLEFGYFLATGKHLDEKNWTLCTGSRYRGGVVPCVSWSPGGRRVYVDWYDPGYSGNDLRSRSVQFLSLAEQAQPA